MRGGKEIYLTLKERGRWGITLPPGGRGGFLFRLIREGLPFLSLKRGSGEDGGNVMFLMVKGG